MRVEAATLSRLLGSWASDQPMSQALATAIENLIEAGLVPAGATLPPQRELASALGISRGTVTAALTDLDGRGVIVSTRGSGSRVRSGRGVKSLNEGRLFSFTNTPPGVIDLSTGSLPASDVAIRVLAEGLHELGDYMNTDGYFPTGLPVLRQVIAHQLTTEGIPTLPAQILVTSGAQQATLLAMTELVGAGDLALTEDPTYRGGLAALRTLGVRVEGIPLRGGGIDVDLVDAAMRRRPTLLYCQTSIHNPTGQTMNWNARTRLGEIITRHGVVTIEDICSSALAFGEKPAPTLARAIDPDLLIMIGSLSKLFWGGIRIGWIRAAEWRIRGFVERRKISDLASSIIDQLYAVRMLARSSEARAERRAMLTEHMASTERLVLDYFPTWSWKPVQGGSGLWVDIDQDATSLGEQAKRIDVKIIAGPGFSSYEGHRTMIRLPLWHEPEQLEVALARLREVAQQKER